MEFLKTNLKAIIVTFVVIAGLIVTVVLVQRQQLIKSKASANSFIITGNDGSAVHTEGPSQFSTNADSVTVGIQDLQGLE